MGKTGLLGKAKHFLKNSRAQSKETSSDAALGITEEDRREILQRIDEMTQKNRVDVAGRAFVAKKHGFVMPLAVNALAVLVTVGGLWALSVGFKAKEAAAETGVAALSSAEGNLIRELKRDSESQLSAKDKEIQDMQTKLASLDEDRAKLQNSFEERVAKKEEELRGRMKVEMDKERARLEALGLSESAIQARLKKFQETQEAAFRKELADFKEKAEQERLAADANYAKLKDEFRNSIAGLNEERKKIQDDAQRREAELRAGLEAKTKEAENSAARANAGLAQAQAELSQVEEARKKALASEERVVGLYLAVRNAVRERRFEDAASGAAALNAYLSDPNSGAGLSGPRKQADLFAVEAFAYMARTELERAGSDTSLLLKQAELVASLRASVADARSAQKAGDEKAAAAAYRVALEKLPEILAAHEYFLRRAKDEEGKRAELSAQTVARAAASVEAGDYEGAAQSYAEAVDLYAVDSKVGASLVEGIAKLGTLRTDKKKTAADTKAAKQAYDKAKADLDKGRWKEALAGFTALLSSYPAAEQAKSSAEGVAKAFAGLEADAEARGRGAEDRIKELEGEALSLQAQLTRTAGEKDAEIARLNELLDRTRKESAMAAELAARRLEEKDSLFALERADWQKKEGAFASERADWQRKAAETPPASPDSADLAQLRSDNERLSAAAQRYDTLVSAYGKFRQDEDSARAAGDAGSLVEARVRFDSFLDNEQTRRTFPDLRDRIVRYEKEFASAGQKESLANAASVVETALRLRDPAARDRYLDDLSDRYKENEDMVAYIATLKKGLR